MSGKLVLVTGVTGFIAGHVALQLIEKGYRVRGTARESKVKVLNSTIKLPGLEFIQVDDVAASDLSEALKGVYAVIHLACPLPWNTDIHSTLNSAIDGTLNVLRQVAAAGIEKIVITSTFGTVMDPSLQAAFAGISFTESQWGNATREQAIAHQSDPSFVYFSAKTIAEKAAWEFALHHPALDLATILPGFVYGPYASHFPLPTPAAFSTNGLIQTLISGAQPAQPPPFFVDVRDVAKAHVRVLDVPRKPPQAKRYLVNAGNYTWAQAAAHLMRRGVRSGVRTASLETFGELPGPASWLDTSRARGELGFGEAEEGGGFVPVERTLEDAVDSIVGARGAGDGVVMAKL